MYEFLFESAAGLSPLELTDRLSQILLRSVGDVVLLIEGTGNLFLFVFQIVARSELSSQSFGDVPFYISIAVVRKTACIPHHTELPHRKILSVSNR